jgi:hypothetical protein
MTNQTIDGAARRERIRRNAATAAALVLGTLTAAGSIAATRTGGSDTVYGASVEIGAGSARVYLDLENGRPVELGVALTESALEGLPHHHSPGGVDFPDGHRMFEEILAMPERNPTPYKYVALGWNPGGHEPPGIYDLPHFDFHFYNAPLEQRSAMDPARPEYDAEAALAPAAELVPQGYVATPGAVAFMGAHWVNPQSPELNGNTFERTFIYGTWNGEVIFAEPMITRAFLQTQPDVHEVVPVAAKHAEPGWYPGAYRVRWDEATREYRVALTDFAWRQ